MSQLLKSLVRYPAFSKYWTRIFSAEGKCSWNVLICQKTCYENVCHLSALQAHNKDLKLNASSLSTYKVQVISHDPHSCPILLFLTLTAVNLSLRSTVSHQLSVRIYQSPLGLSHISTGCASTSWRNQFATYAELNHQVGWQIQGELQDMIERTVA